LARSNIELLALAGRRGNQALLGNIQLNNQQLPASLSGELTRTDQMRSCQRVLTTVANLIIDVQACKPHQHADLTQAAAIAGKIESSLPS
jgi:hypothetical protein